MTTTAPQTEVEIAERIRRERAAGARAVDLAARYGIAPSTVAGITTGKRWVAA